MGKLDCLISEKQYFAAAWSDMFVSTVIAQCKVPMHALHTSFYIRLYNRPIHLSVDEGTQLTALLKIGLYIGPSYRPMLIIL